MISLYVLHAFIQQPIFSVTVQHDFWIEISHLPPTRRLISRQGGNTAACCVQCFQSVVSALIKWPRWSLLMILEVPRCWVICLAPYHLQVGLYCWSGGPTMGPFPSAFYLLVPLAHPSTCTGSLFSLPALLRGLCGRESHNPSALRMCTCLALLCFSSCWGVFAEGTKWSQTSFSNRLKEHALCVWR